MKQIALVPSQLLTFAIQGMPETEEEALEITQEQLRWLLNGIDFRNAHKTLKYSRVV